MNEELLTAVYRKKYEKLKNMVNSGVDINSVDSDGRSALVYAILAEDANPEMVNFLIKLGSDVNSRDAAQEWTPLHFAARNQLLEIVKILLEKGADPNAVETFGNTPIARCMDDQHPNLKIIELIIKYGGDVKRKNNYGTSPIDIAELTGNRELLDSLNS